MPPVEREITLGDYGRVLWRGRWVLLAAAVGAGLIALITSVARQPTYSSSSLVYMGLATTAKTGVPVSTPFTTPATAQKAIVADRFISAAANATGIDEDRVRDGVSATVERVPGAAGGNQPTVATLRYKDRDKATAIAVTNAYVDAVLAEVQGSYDDVIASQERIVDRGEKRIIEIQSTLDRRRRQGSSDLTPVIVGLQSELYTVQFSADEAQLTLAKARQQEQPRVISKASTAASSAAPGQRFRSVVFGTILGLILGAIVTFAWRGSPAGRAADAT